MGGFLVGSRPSLGSFFRKSFPLSLVTITPQPGATLIRLEQLGRWATVNHIVG